MKLGMGVIASQAENLFWEKEAFEATVSLKISSDTPVGPSLWMCGTCLLLKSSLWSTYFLLPHVFSSPPSNTSCLWLSVTELPGALIVLESLHFYNLILLFRRKFDSSSPNQKENKGVGGKSCSSTSKGARCKKTRLFSFIYSWLWSAFHFTVCTGLCSHHLIEHYLYCIL